MKKLLITLCVLCGLITNAETFFGPEDMKVSFTQRRMSNYWQSDFAAPNWSYGYIDGKGVIYATWLIQGRFASIYFAQEKTDLGVCGTYGITNMNDLNNAVITQLLYSSGNIKFDKIAYDPITKVILIPYGTISDFTGSSYNCLEVSLYDAINGVSSPITEDATKINEAYYNLEGQTIDPETYRNKIIIKSNGNSSKKVVNTK